MFSLTDIKECLGKDFLIEGNEKFISFDNLKTLETADANSLVWISPRKKNITELINSTKAAIIICSKEINESFNNKCLIKVENPKLSMIRIIKNLFSPDVKYGIHASAFIHKDAQVHKDVYIGPFTYIGKSVIGKGTIIHGHCHVFDNVKIGKYVSINAGSILGSEGFGYELNEKKEYEKFIHIGGVEIQNNVDIGANTCIVRGTLGNTVIGEGTKIDNLVHVGHNAMIGKHCIITANNMVGGSVIIEDYSWLGPSSSTLNQLTLSENSYAGLGSVITKSIPEGEVWAGNPARPISDIKKLQEKFREMLSDE